MGTNQQYYLQWSNYVQYITGAFDCLRSDEDLVDVTLSCEGKKILAHKMLLSACSTYFKEVFKDNPCKHPVIIFRNVKFEDLVAIVDFMYHGEVSVEQEQLSSFLMTAEMLAVQGLTYGTRSSNKDNYKEENRQRHPSSVLKPSLLGAVRDLTNDRPNHQPKTSILRSNIPHPPSVVSFHNQPQSNRPSTTPTAANRKRKFSPIKIVNSINKESSCGESDGKQINKKSVLTLTVVKKIDSRGEAPIIPKLKVNDFDDNDHSYSEQESGMMDVSQVMDKNVYKDIAELFSTSSRDSPHPPVKEDGVPCSEIEIKKELDIDIPVDEIKEEELEIQEDAVFEGINLNTPEDVMTQDELDVDTPEDVTIEDEMDDDVPEDKLNEESNSDLPEDVNKAASKAKFTVLPEKSKERYDFTYEAFKKWQTQQNFVGDFSENTLMAYFKTLSGKYAPTSLWSQWSMLRCTLEVNDKIDISKYRRLLSFIKSCNEGYAPKKVKTFTEAEIKTFLELAPDSTYLVMKVVAIFGVVGGCRTNELTNLKIRDVKQFNNMLLVTIPETIARDKVERTFAISGEHFKIVEKYIKLRPKIQQNDRFFLLYRNQKCVKQPIGKNSIGKMGMQIAKFLDLPNCELYTARSFKQKSTAPTVFLIPTLRISSNAEENNTENISLSVQANSAD